MVHGGSSSRCRLRMLSGSTVFMLAYVYICDAGERVQCVGGVTVGTPARHSRISQMTPKAVKQHWHLPRSKEHLVGPSAFPHPLPPSRCRHVHLHLEAANGAWFRSGHSSFSQAGGRKQGSGGRGGKRMTES